MISIGWYAIFTKPNTQLKCCSMFSVFDIFTYTLELYH